MQVRANFLHSTTELTILNCYHWRPLPGITQGENALVTLTPSLLQLQQLQVVDCLCKVLWSVVPLSQHIGHVVTSTPTLRVGHTVAGSAAATAPAASQSLSDIRSNHLQRQTSPQQYGFFTDCCGAFTCSRPALQVSGYLCACATVEGWLLHRQPLPACHPPVRPRDKHH